MANMFHFLSTNVLLLVNMFAKYNEIFLSFLTPLHVRVSVIWMALRYGSFHVKSPRFCKVTSRILMKLGVFVVTMVLTTHTNF